MQSDCSNLRCLGCLRLDAGVDSGGGGPNAFGVSLSGIGVCSERSVMKYCSSVAFFALGFRTAFGVHSPPNVAVFTTLGFRGRFNPPPTPVLGTWVTAARSTSCISSWLVAVDGRRTCEDPLMSQPYPNLNYPNINNIPFTWNDLISYCPPQVPWQALKHSEQVLKVTFFAGGFLGALRFGAGLLFSFPTLPCEASGCTCVLSATVKSNPRPPSSTLNHQNTFATEYWTSPSSLVVSSVPLVLEQAPSSPSQHRVVRPTQQVPPASKIATTLNPLLNWPRRSLCPIFFWVITKVKTGVQHTRTHHFLCSGLPWFSLLRGRIPALRRCLDKSLCEIEGVLQTYAHMCNQEIRLSITCSTKNVATLSPWGVPGCLPRRINTNRFHCRGSIRIVLHIYWMLKSSPWKLWIMSWKP